MPTKHKDSLAAKCREAGLDYAIVWKRINVDGWTKERALSEATHVSRGTPKWRTYLRVRAKELGLDPERVVDRVERGWSEEKALGTPTKPPKPTKPAAPKAEKPRQEKPRKQSAEERLKAKQWEMAVKEKAKKAGLPPDLCLARIVAGWPEKAVYGTKENGRKPNGLPNVRMPRGR